LSRVLNTDGNKTVARRRRRDRRDWLWIGVALAIPVLAGLFLPSRVFLPVVVVLEVVMLALRLSPTTLALTTPWGVSLKLDGDDPLRAPREDDVLRLAPSEDATGGVSEAALSHDPRADDRRLAEQQLVLLCEELESQARTPATPVRGRPALRTGDTAAPVEQSEQSAAARATAEAEAVRRWWTIFHHEIGAVLAARDAVARPPHRLTLAEIEQAVATAEELQLLLSEGRRQAGEAGLLPAAA
jgi:hypothetical protein